MTRKEECYAILAEQKGDFVSGQSLADRLCISRAAVWKIIAALKKEGCEILTTHQGYCLQADDSLFSAQSIAARLRGSAKDCKIIVEEEVTSTNLLQKQAGERAEAAPSVLIARAQTQGRGRLGRTFFSPEQTGLYFSILLRPEFDLSQSMFLTVCAAAAVAEAIEAVAQKKTGIKWVNDIFIGNRKVCGILTEAAIDVESRKLRYAVLGVGVNLLAPKSGFPSELSAIAGSVWEAHEVAQSSALCAEILNRFFDYYAHFDDHRFLESYRDRNILIGKTVQYHKEGQSQSGVVLEIDADAALVLQNEQGEVVRLQCGEVSVRYTDLCVPNA